MRLEDAIGIDRYGAAVIPYMMRKRHHPFPSRTAPHRSLSPLHLVTFIDGYTPAGIPTDREIHISRGGRQGLE